MEKKFPPVPNSICRIISMGSNPEVSNRLSQMGIIPGLEVTIVRVGPLGDPLELSFVSGQNIALRSGEFQSLECEIIAIPLVAVDPGPGIYRIQKLQGGMGYQRKMIDRGLVVGAKFRVQEKHPFRVCLLPDGPCAVIGRGEAQKLLLESLVKDVDQT
jgi:Fe2+ transport system protein FeoA